MHQPRVVLEAELAMGNGEERGKSDCALGATTIMGACAGGSQPPSAGAQPVLPLLLVLLVSLDLLTVALSFFCPRSMR